MMHVLRRVTNSKFLSTTSYNAIQESRRLLGSASDKIIVKKDTNSGAATLYMNYAPVNHFDIDMIKCFTETIKAVETDPKIKGVILTSKFDGKVFSAGLNVYDLFERTHEYLKDLWWNFQELHLTFYGCRKPTVACINGHAPGGACAVALMCDYRVMQKGANKVIGLNESLVGAAPTYPLCDLMIRAIGQRKGEKAVLTGKLFSAEEAVACGLVDEIGNQADINQMARNALATLMSPVSPAFADGKMFMREKHLNHLRQTREEECVDFATRLTLPETQQNIKNYVKSLALRKKP